MFGADPALVDEHSATTGDLGVSPWIPFVGGIEKVTGERVKRTRDDSVDATATAGGRCRMILAAHCGAGDARPGRRVRVVVHRRGKQEAVVASAHAEKPPSTQRCGRGERELPLLNRHAARIGGGRCERTWRRSSLSSPTAPVSAPHPQAPEISSPCAIRAPDGVTRDGRDEPTWHCEFAEQPQNASPDPPGRRDACVRPHSVR